MIKPAWIDKLTRAVTGRRSASQTPGAELGQDTERGQDERADRGDRSTEDGDEGDEGTSGSSAPLG